MIAAQHIWELAARIAPGVTMDMTTGVCAVFIADEHWLDDEDKWSWFLADHRLDRSPHYWGVQA